MIRNLLLHNDADGAGARAPGGDVAQSTPAVAETPNQAVAVSTPLV